MGQYFKLVNLDKKEYINPYDLGGLGKLWEWCANDTPKILPFLLRKSTGGGGGDIHGDYEYAGHWAGDRIVLIGDYDETGLYQMASEKYKNISIPAAKEFNEFMGHEKLQLEIEDEGD